MICEYSLRLADSSMRPRFFRTIKMTHGNRIGFITTSISSVFQITNSSLYDNFQ